MGDNMKEILLSAFCFILFFIISIITFFSGVRGLKLYLLIIVIFILSLAVIKIIDNCIKYGGAQVFSVFRKRKNQADKNSVFIQSLKSQINSKVFVLKEHPNIYLILNQNGILLYSFLTYPGTIFREGAKWFYKDGTDKTEIGDPNLELSEEENRLSTFFNLPILSYFVLDTQTSMLNLEAKYPVIKVDTAPYYLTRTDMLMNLSEENIAILAKAVVDSGLYEEK